MTLSAVDIGISPIYTLNKNETRQFLLNFTPLYGKNQQ